MTAPQLLQLTHYFINDANSAYEKEPIAWNVFKRTYKSAGFCANKNSSAKTPSQRVLQENHPWVGCRRYHSKNLL
jgi:hypothetical protein